MVITFIREELKELLGVSENGLKTIVKRGKLEDRINDVGYNLVNTYKIGRNTIYELSLPENDVADIRAFKELQNKWRIRKKEEHMEYVSDRITEDGLRKSRSAIIDNNDKLKGISKHTAKSWDDKLEEENIIKKDGFVYFRILEDGKREECCREEYSQYWADNAWVKRAINEAYIAYRKGLTNKVAYDDKSYELHRYMYNKYGYIIRKYQSYAEADEMANFRKMLRNR